MSIPSLHKSDPVALSKLMEIDDTAEHLWDQNDLAEIWQHQLDAPLDFDLAGDDARQKQRISSLSVTAIRPPKTFRDLLHHPNPPVELLRLAKEFAKASPKDKNRPLPQQIATALYYASIVAAFVHAESISTLKESELREGMRWAVAQSWLDKPTHALFEEGLKKLPA